MILKVIKDVAKEICDGWLIVLSPFILLVPLLTALFFLQNCNQDKVTPTPAHKATLAYVVNTDDPKPECKDKIKQIKSQRDRMAKELDKIKSMLDKKNVKKGSKG